MIYPYERGFIHRPLPEGYSFISLEDEEDILHIRHCLWKGFDHGPNPNAWADELPIFPGSLTTIVKAVNGDYACFASMRVDEKNGGF